MLGGSKYFSVTDMQVGFHQIKLTKDSQPKTAFSSPWGHFSYTRLPMGIKVGPSAFQRVINNVLLGIRDEICLVYLDDVICFSSTMEKHISSLSKIFYGFRESNLTVNFEKCKFGVSKVNYLGFLLNEQGIQPDMRKIDTVKNFPISQTVKNVRQFLGLAGFYRSHIKDFSKIARPLFELTKDNVKFKWMRKCREAFEILRDKLIQATILKYPDFEKELVLSIDASKEGLGCLIARSRRKITPYSIR